MRKKVLQALEKSLGDYTEIRLEEENRTEISYQKDNLENIESSEEVGGIVRTLSNGGWGIVTFNRIDGLEDKVEEAYQIARTVSANIEDRAELTPVETNEDEHSGALENDFREVSLDQKQQLVANYNDIIFNFDDQIISTNVRYADSYRKVVFANTDGTYIKQEAPDITLLLAAVAREGKRNIQRTHETIGEAGGFEIVQGKDDLCREVGERAVNLLDAQPAEGGKYKVILNPDLAGVFIHEAFGHLCEADHIYKNERLSEVMEIGRRFGGPELNVVDEGYIPQRRGNVPYDDEGVPREKTYLIKDGVLNSFLHSRETAAKMGHKPTGNARAISYRHEPIVRMTNTYVEEGQHTFQSMLEDVDDGIYALDAYGGQTQLEQFTFSAGYAFKIEDGEISNMVRDVVLTGNVFETLGNIAKIGDDLDIIGSAGGCGKGGQAPLPVTDGSPHLLIEDVTIGGR